MRARRDGEDWRHRSTQQLRLRSLELLCSQLALIFERRGYSEMLSDLSGTQWRSGIGERDSGVVQESSCSRTDAYIAVFRVRNQEVRSLAIPQVHDD
jgi:hypothetical protein